MDRIAEEISFCLKYEPEQKGTCRGAGGGKLRRVCVRCPNFLREKRSEEDAGDETPGRRDHV